MTDKQIIKDGVDVSGCSSHYNGWSQLYRDNRDMCDRGYDLECKPKENGCYHYTKCLEEQLKAKEQECEELKEKLNCCFCNPYVELNNIEKQRKCIEVTECFRRQLDKLKQTLTEIRKIAETQQSWNECNMKFSETESEDDIFAYNWSALNQILQKISECEVENDN